MIACCAEIIHTHTSTKYDVCHKNICGTHSLLTQSKLLAHPSVADHTLADLPAASAPTTTQSSGKKGGKAAGKAKDKAPAAAAVYQQQDVVQPVLLLIDSAG